MTMGIIKLFYANLAFVYRVLFNSYYRIKYKNVKWKRSSMDSYFEEITLSGLVQEAVICLIPTPNI